MINRALWQGLSSILKLERRPLFSAPRFRPPIPCPGFIAFPVALFFGSHYIYIGGHSSRSEPATLSQNTAALVKARPLRAKYIVALRGFLPLANFIAQHRSHVVSVPRTFPTTIDRLILLRAPSAE